MRGISDCLECRRGLPLTLREGERGFKTYAGPLITTWTMNLLSGFHPPIRPPPVICSTRSFIRVEGITCLYGCLAVHDSDMSAPMLTAAKSTQFLVHVWASNLLLP
ncbi:hypothetical protein BDN72DRAFT_377745 [Pluteus cervinus]|uniref:Uncharacterized protein n=1 Tax=Pluteus cervinus TaxID=181527 RepID=A0ACD3AAN5_9AGAR|nr:hypothetical protein BDN72DRAFT_377745 [Pluteus cervinus]